jgi:DNA topoisomerase-1
MKNLFIALKYIVDMAKRKSPEEIETSQFRQNAIRIDEYKDAVEVREKQKPKRSELEKVEKVAQIEKTEKVDSKPAKSEKIISKPAKTKSVKKITKTSKTKKILSEREEKFERHNIQGNYELIVTEKPQAAMKIADALADGVIKKNSMNGVYYYELMHGEKKIVVACAVGHLFSLTSTERGFPIFNLEWQPNYKVRKHDFTKKYYSTIYSLARGANSFVIATDYDIEGELIGYNVMRFILKQKTAERMKFSTLTKPEIEESYEKKMKDINFGLAVSGETRHMLDWFYGINLSRALMSALSKAGAFRIISIGRVQGPALAFVVKRELEIQKFKPTPYWQIFIIIEHNKQPIELKYEKDVTKKTELEKFKGLKGKEAEVVTEKRDEKLYPPLPFDLTTLQTEAYRMHGITPSSLLKVAQSLYLAGLISYPRTSSQKLPESIGYKKILSKLSKNGYSAVVSYAKNPKPIEGKKEDAHPAIFPTGENGKMKDDEKKIYDLIVRRFISCFCEPALLVNKKIIARVGELKFTTNGLEIKQKGWMSVYKINMQEKDIPDINGKAKIKDLRIEEKETQPPKRYSQASLVSELARRNLGTKATRAMIIDTLYNRGYVAERSIRATPMGIQLISTLEKEAPMIIDEKLTRHIEAELTEIEKSKDSEKKKQKVVSEVKEIITKISMEMKEKAVKIGKELLNGHMELREEERENAKLMKCLKCGEGSIVMRKGKFGYFAACDKYPACKTTFSLPKNGLIKKTDKICECGYPLMLLIKKGKRPWQFCFNPECEFKGKKRFDKKEGTSDGKDEGGEEKDEDEKSE